MAQLLREAIHASPYRTVRGFARHLAGGDKASLKEIEDERRALNKHLNEGQQPERPRAELYARELGVPLDMFVRPISRQSRREQELEAQVRQLRAEIAELRQGV